MALSKAVLLGEALPPMRLAFQDSHGNTVPIADEMPPAVTLQVLEAGPGGGGAVLQELQAEADMVSALGWSYQFSHCFHLRASQWLSLRVLLPHWACGWGRRPGG